MLNRVFLNCLIACFCSFISAGQNDSTLLSSALNRANKNINDIKNGRFKLTLKFKPATDEDTMIFTGVCNYYKNIFKDEMAEFIIYQDSQPTMIYQDKNFMN